MADAEYVIDIATQMPDGEVTLDQLEDLSKSLQGGGKTADFFQKAILKTSEALDASRVASKAANVALAEGSSEYKILERSALQASKAVERAMRKGEVSPELTASLTAATAAVDKYAINLAKVEKEAERAAGAEKKFSKQLKNVNKLATHVKDTLGENASALANLRGALGDIGGPMGELGEAVLKPAQAYADLTEFMGKSKAAMIVSVFGVAALVAVLVVLVAIVLAATLAFAAFAVKLANTRREAALAAEALDAINPTVKALRGGFKQLTRETGLGTSALEDLTKQLQDAKVSAEDMPAALRAAALAEAALGQGGAAKFIKQIKDGKLEVDKFAANAQVKFGGIVARQMMGLGAQAEQMKRNMADIFGSLDIDSVLKGFRVLVDLFDQTTASGRAMKLLFKKIFQPIIDQAENAAFFVEAFVLGFLIGMTKMYLAVKPVIKWVTDLFGFEDTSLEDILAKVSVGAEYLAYAFGLLVIGFGFVVGAIAALFAPIGIAVAAFIALQVISYKLSVFIGGFFVEMWGKAVDFLKGISLKDIGVQMINGMISGLLGAGPGVIAAITGIAGSAISAAKRALGIASPSKAFTDIGNNVTDSFAGSVEDGEADAKSALESLVEPPDAPSMSAGAAGASGADGASAGGSASVTINGNTFILNGIADAEDAEQRIGELITRLMEGDATQLGAEA